MSNKFHKHVICNQRFRGTIEELKEIVGEYHEGSWTYESPFYQFQTEYYSSSIRWWPDSGDIQFVHDAFENDARGTSYAGDRVGPGEWLTLNHKRKPNLSLPEYFFFDPYAFRMRVGQSFPERLKDQANEIMTKVRAIRIPEQYQNCVVAHKFEHVQWYTIALVCFPGCQE